jgi:hypothetical protein
VTYLKVFLVKSIFILLVRMKSMLDLWIEEFHEYPVGWLKICKSCLVSSFVRFGWVCMFFCYHYDVWLVNGEVGLKSELVWLWID